LTELVELARSGDERSWNRLVDRLGSLVWSIIRTFRIPENDAVDIFQTAWLQLARRLSTITDPERVGLWLATTTRRECLAYVRRSHLRFVSVSFDLFPDHAAFTSIDTDELIVREGRRQLWQALELLPDSCRALLRMFLADPEPSYAEVAAALDMPINSVGPRRTRCLGKLRDQLGDGTDYLTSSP
jgi:RNA polymerase sigma factor (sigma-70 family)